MSVQFTTVPGSEKPVLTAAVVTFNAALAKEWLEHRNNRNRPIGKTDVKKYAAAMCGGEWELNGEPIVLDDKQKLVNGQHRLSAVILAAESDPDIEVPMLVVAGVKSRAFDTFDQGRPRTLADVLAVNQEENAVTLAAALRLLWLRTNNAKVSGGGALRSATAVELLDTHKGIMDSVSFFLGGEDGTGLEQQTREDENCDCRFSRLLSPAHAAALHYLMVQAESGAESDPVEPTDAATGSVAEFFRGLAFGTAEDGTTALPATDPRKKARTTLLRSSNSESKLTRDGKIGVVIRAWLAFRDGENPSRLVPVKGEFPRIGGLDVDPVVEPDEPQTDTTEDTQPAQEERKPRQRTRKAKAHASTTEEDTATAGD